MESSLLGSKRDLLCVGGDVGTLSTMDFECNISNYNKNKINKLLVVRSKSW